LQLPGCEVRAQGAGDRNRSLACARLGLDEPRDAIPRPHYADDIALKINVVPIERLQLADA
jgi:hypothetical protein